ncbi:HTTM domain-containing protein [Nitriliruptor alkaliphilus]|uniref:HTTM domain-containing protein n=1 Tax=Nitriliruptor alkaliphilus TaxID=427918 RepID=UPI000697827D|nr:HTTM domain-containing protein [Nitriliruptor alkaliphilus]
MRRPILDAAARPVSGASIALLRIAFGVFMVIDVGLYLPQLVTSYYVEPSFNFAYDPWGLVRPLPGEYTMHLVYVVKGIAGVLIALGLWYRWAAATLFALTTYVFLLDSSFFQNHEYLISMLSLWLIVLPTHRMWSLDARRRPHLASTTQPAWILWFLRFQLGVPYVYGGIAKLNADWFAGEPIRMWLAARTDVQVIGRWFTNEPVVWFAAYGSLLLDLTVVGFLLHRRTRVPAFVIAVTFHLLNARLFGLFVFPWLMIVATTIFFDPDWPLRVRDRWRARGRGGAAPVDPASAPRREGPVTAPATFDGTRPAPHGRRLSPAVGAILAVWILVQLLVPLRHLAIPGDANWTEEGHRFAWHMMLRTKSGTVTFTVDDGRDLWVEDPLDHLSEAQFRRLPGHPERLARFAHHLSDLYGGAEVRADTSVALNGRTPVPIVDPDLDLSTVQVPWWGHAEWILPNPEPLRPDRSP